jgi:hypothetical protein
MRLVIFECLRMVAKSSIVNMSDKTGNPSGRVYGVLF